MTVTIETQKSAQKPAIWHPPSPHSASKKKRRTANSNETCLPQPIKREHGISVRDGTADVPPIVRQDDLIDYWIQHDSQWSNYLRETVTMENSSPKKRALSRSNSWKMSTDSGNTPKAWGGKHAAAMLDSGIFLEQQEGARIVEVDEHLCENILAARYELPSEWRFQANNFAKMVKLSLYKNESRVTRDLWPHIMPSPEIHHAQGHPGVEHIAEGVDAQWTKCASLCGPKPRPDMCHGVSRFTFSKEEREKLILINTCASETMFFPFYICEAKCFDTSIEESELQALHGASVACNAIIELYQKISATKELDRRILAFSVSHDQRKVKIFAHFPIIDDNDITFHRYRLFETDFVDDASNHSRPYQIALGIWEHFYPIHLARIRQALGLQSSRTMESFTGQLDLEESQISTPSSSQEYSQSKRASSSLVRRTQSDNESLRAQLSSLMQELRVQREESQKQLIQQKEESQKQLIQQKEESQKQLAVLERLITRLPQPDS